MMVILQKIPLWVYVLFVGLVFLGWFQSKDRVVPYSRAFIFPSLMLLYSIYGVASTFGAGIALVAWAIGMMIMTGMGIRIRAFYSVLYVEEKHAFAIKGSWLWMGIIMAIFWLKFAVGFAMAREINVVSGNWFIFGMSLGYGLLSGIFFVRMVILYKIYSTHKKAL